ncbi:MAG: preprotein translocase subunit SecA [Planctomycetota bacterium]
MVQRDTGSSIRADGKPCVLAGRGAPGETARAGGSRRSPAPSDLWRQLSQAGADRGRIPHGLDAAWNAALGSVARRQRQRRFLLEAHEIVAAESADAGLGEQELRAALAATRDRFRLGQERPDDVLRAVGLVREAAARAVGLRAHPVQVAAALAIHAGCIAEMATGEGKTLAASIAAVLAGWRGRGCHVLTFNHYLAERDAEAVRPTCTMCGLTVAHVEAAMTPDERRRAYLADVTYCTNQDVAADYLRDQLSLGRHHRLAAVLLDRLAGEDRTSGTPLVMRGLASAIIDEADSILIDEAVTPLIISGDAPNAKRSEAYVTAARVAARLEAGVHYLVDRQHGEIRLTRAGAASAEQSTHVLGGVWAAPSRREELVVQALVARELFARDQQYVIEDGDVVIVDESTGRLMPDRTWRGGLHEAIQAKEGLELTAPKETMARISFQRFFRMYGHLGGTTGTAWEARSELQQIYGLPVIVLPTHRPCRRHVAPDRVFLDERSKWSAVLEEIRAVHATGRPILVGTRSVASSEQLSARLIEAGLEHQVLNAVRHAEEATVVARAGERGRVTVATNMAGRGTDIKLGAGVADLGGLHVIATERHESGRIDRQLFGRAARQGDPGSAVAFASLDDEICRRYAPAALRWLAHRRPGRAGAVVTLAQRRAERLAARQRQEVLRTDEWLDRFLGFTGRSAAAA